MMLLNKKGFTLVELIVVITILSILWTIAFVSFQGYGIWARNNVKIQDLRTMETALELFKLERGIYPDPTDAFDVTYQGWLAWKQWKFWEQTRTNVSRLPKVSLDPSTGTEYAYSITNSRTEFQLWALWEPSVFGQRNPQIFTSVYAADQPAIALTIWNYNGKVLSVRWNDSATNSTITDYILAVPSIMTRDDTQRDLDQIYRTNLVYDQASNLPSTYVWTWWKTDGWFDYNPTPFVLFEWDLSVLGDKTERVKLALKTKASYEWTTLENHSNYQELQNIDVDVASEFADIENITQEELEALGVSVQAQASNLIVWIVSNEVWWIRSPWLTKDVLSDMWENTGGNDWDWWVIDEETASVWAYCDDLTSEWVINLNNAYGGVSWIHDQAWWCSMTTLDSNGYSYGFYEGLTDIIPETWYLQNLTTLYFEPNCFETYNVTEGIKNLSHLTELLLWQYSWYCNWHISFNVSQEIWSLPLLNSLALMDTDITSIPSIVSSAGNLNYLHLASNPLLTSIDNIWILTSLTELTINDNPWINSIPSWIWTLWNLSTLTLSRNDLSNLPLEISNLNNLTELYLHWNSWLWNLSRSFDKNAAQYCDAVWPNGEEICIEWNGTTIDITVSVWGGDSWKDIDTHCSQDDIPLWWHTWAWCNSTLWTGMTYEWPCYDYAWNDANTTTCHGFSDLDTVYSPTHGVGNIWWKLYDYPNLLSACPMGWHVPTLQEWVDVEHALGHTNATPSFSNTSNALGWQGHESLNASNNIVNALLLPLSWKYNSDGNVYWNRWDMVDIWSISNIMEWYRHTLSLRYNQPDFIHNYDNGEPLFMPVRCVKD